MGTRRHDMEKRCTTQGHWRRCLACKGTPSENDYSTCYRRTLVDLDSSDRRRCEGICGLKREQTCFVEGASKCNACKLWETLHVCMCAECHSIKKYSQMGKFDHHNNKGTCYGCAPELQLVKCTVCSEERPARDFRGTYPALLKEYHRRCNKC